MTGHSLDGSGDDPQIRNPGAGAHVLAILASAAVFDRLEEPPLVAQARPGYLGCVGDDGSLDAKAFALVLSGGL